ncbi:macrophage mannose receptor 1-like [Acanthaster planci]|uniref:Macrophage mannose receptor 1-like n=1 Tax=Acanthaster planci TaxID=133434 RepID=A0A8B7XUV3_ACAPL|nr:macrophage mannose receptor 1-like [Acanthaster planci]
MAGLGVWGLFLLAVAVPQVYSIGCPDNFYRLGEVCLTLISSDKKSFEDANSACKGLNAQASLAIISDYRRQAQIVAMMRSYQGDDVYIGLKATPDNPFFFWADDSMSNPTFTRWGVGQPDGYPILTKEDYCVVLDNSNTKQPGFWYDVPCTETHRYICSMDLDDRSNSSAVPPALRCPYGFYALGDSACFGFNDTLSTYNEAETACQALSQNPGEEIHLAMILDGYESALIETMMYSLGLSHGWIGLRSTDREFGWITGYPVVYTNWGANEPSAEESEGCVRARTDQQNWDDTTCNDNAAYFCRFDRFGMPLPTSDPDTEKLPCPSGWESFGSNCYYFSDVKTDWGEGNFRCMRMYEGATLASITSAAENEFVYSRANNRYPANDFVWIGLTRVQTGNNDWTSFGWLDQNELNYIFWSKGEPSVVDSDTVLLESCVAMSITTAGAGAWSDEICQFSALYSVCKLPKRTTYTDRKCVSDNEIKFGDYCYLPSTVSGSKLRSGTWNEAENECRSQGGNLASVFSEDEQTLVQVLSFGFAKSYWIGLRQYGNSDFAWSDGTAYDKNTYSGFPGGQPPVNLADEEECAELLIWQKGEWATSACGNTLSFVCKRKETESDPKPLLPGYPTTGGCPDDYFKLGNRCYSVKGTTASERKGWIAARDDCRSDRTDRGWTLATVSHPGQQALMTAIIKAFEGVDMWIGLNGIGIHNQYHWSDESPLEYTAWMEGQPDNLLPITDPNSQSCVVMMNNPDDPGSWNDVTCSVPRAYLCQSPLVTAGGTPPDLPGSQCADNRYSQYFDTCFLVEREMRRSFDDARTDCQSKGGDLLSVFDRYEAALFTSSLYEEGLDESSKAYIGLRRNAVTGVFEWIDNWPLEFTMWGPNEPHNRKGDCVVLNREGFWEVSLCSTIQNYICEYPSPPPDKPGLRRGVCPEDYVELPGTDYCVLFATSQTRILWEEGTYICTTQHNGGVLPSIHSQAEDDFIWTEAKKVFTETNAKIWLGMRRDQTGFSSWDDLSLMDYVNWQANEPSDDANENNKCVQMDLTSGEWADVQCSLRANYICKAPKYPAPPTRAPTQKPPPDSAAFRPVSSLLSVLLVSGAAFLCARW